MKLEGVIVPVATPLDGEASMSRLVEYLIASGVDGLFANGSMGGFAFHEDAAQVATVERVCRCNNGRKPLLAGISDTSVARVIGKARMMRHIPIDAYVVLPPYYFIYDQAALVRFFTMVADAVERPVVLYENPRLAHNSMTPETIAVLAAHPNIIGLKISTGDVELWKSLPHDGFALIAGAEKMMSQALELGFDGITGGFHNLFAPTAVALFRAARAGQFDAAHRYQEQLNRAYRVFEIAGGWRGLEIAFRYMGIAAKAAPAPFDTPAPVEAQAEILEILKREGCPVPYPVEI